MSTERGHQRILGGFYDPYALFGCIFADDHGRCGQLRVGRIHQCEHSMDVQLYFVELTPEESGLDQIGSVLL